MAITWRNVGGGDNAGAIRNLLAASSSATGAFDNLRGVVRDAELADKQNQDLQKATNTSAFLDTLQSQYASPEALQAAIASGEVNALRQGYGTNIDANAVRGAADARLTALRQQGLAGRQYSNQVLDDQDQTALSRLQALAIQGDPNAAQELANISDRNKGKGATALFGAQRDRFGFETEQEKEADRNVTHALSLRQGEAQIQSANASAAASRASTAASNIRSRLGNLDLEDRTRARQFQGGIEAEVQKHQNDVTQYKNAVRQVASSNPGMFTLTKDGDVDVRRMNQGQLDAANGLLATQGLPSLDTLVRGDTAAQERLIAKLNAAGAPLSVIQSVKQGGDWFNTSKPTAIGNDAATAVFNEKRKAVVDQQTFDAAGGIPTKAGDFTEVMKIVGPSIPKDGSDQVKRALATYFKENGVDISGVKRYLPANVIAQVVQGAKDPWGPGEYERDTLLKLRKLEKDFQSKLSGAVKAETEKNVSATLK